MILNSTPRAKIKISEGFENWNSAMKLAGDIVGVVEPRGVLEDVADSTSETSLDFAILKDQMYTFLLLIRTII